MPIQIDHDGHPIYDWFYVCVTPGFGTSPIQLPPQPDRPYVAILDANTTTNQIRVVLGPVRLQSGDLGAHRLALELFTADARRVTIVDQALEPGSYEFQFPFESLPDGTYVQLVARWEAAPGIAVRGLNLRAPICSGGENDARTTMLREYLDFNVNWRPSCADFANSGGSAHFSWAELNGQFSQGNPHEPWGIIVPGVLAGLESTRTLYNRGGIRVTSGYRCPHGNNSLPGSAAQSYHMQGRAVDIYSLNHPWTEEEFNLLRDAAADTGTVELFLWTTYADRHLHVAW